MKTLKNLTLTIIALWTALGTCAHGQATSRLSSTFLARGEQALLEVAVTGGQFAEVPEISAVPNISIQPIGQGPQTRMLPGRKLEYIYEYILSGYEPGRHVIPPVEVRVNGAKTRTEPLNFVIFNPDELKWSTVESGGKTIRYASSFRTLNETPFENETVPTEIKLYFPAELAVVDFGIPDFERDGLTAWRFQPSPMPGRVNLLGIPHIAVAYPSTITPTRTGKIGIGPAKVRLTMREVVMDPSPRWINPEIYVQVPRLDFTAKPLPAGAPEGFENAVGSFKLRATTAVTEVQEGDPLTVDLVVTGSGNLDILHPPKLTRADGWKTYGTTTEQRGDERRELSGSVTFHQSIRALEVKSEIPPFRLVYFDPKTESYQTLTTEPIALQMTPGEAPRLPAETAVQALPVPLERMTDILAVLHPADLTRPVPATRPAWLVHAVGGLLALVLIAKAMWMRCAPRLRQDPDREARARELRAMEKSAADTDFLKAAGSFIERWLGATPAPEVQAVLAERDAVCFRAEQAKSQLPSNRRAEILKLLRRATLAVIVTTALCLPPAARAADTASQAHEAYQAAKYDDALKLWLGAAPYDQLSADTLYNIGNACYRSNAPGLAALYYRRALVRDSAHQEARQNLRFIEKKYGAIVVPRPEYQYQIAKLPLTTWQTACWTGAWLCGLGLLVFPATRSGARLRVVACCVLALAPILIGAGAIGWRYFPDDAEFAPVGKQAVIIAENVALHTDAARTSPEVIDAPPGSLCEIIRESGSWAYVAFSNKTRGWVPVEMIEKILPDKAPTPPKFRKPKADGKTA